MSHLETSNAAAHPRPSRLELLKEREIVVGSRRIRAIVGAAEYVADVGSARFRPSTDTISSLTRTRSVTGVRVIDPRWTADNSPCSLLHRHPPIEGSRLPIGPSSTDGRYSASTSGSIASLEDHRTGIGYGYSMHGPRPPKQGETT